MNIKIVVGVIIALVVVGIAGSYLEPRDSIRAIVDPLNASYDIDGALVTLASGHATQRMVSESSSTMEVSVFGKPTLGDVDADGDDDAVVILMVNFGGTGTFYYVAVATNGDTGTKGTNALLLGDRIAPQNVEIKNGIVIANYADRAPGEPFITRPSVGTSKYAALRNGMLVDLWPATKRDLIEVATIHPGDIISSPLLVAGRARGTWYFEASFPVRLIDHDGNNIPLTPPYITANGEWMTTEFVPFSDTLTFTPPPSGTRGTLIFQKDNPSGLPEHGDSLEIPVIFR